ncbi:uncharacterized protein LOC127902346 [Citrus sinensis]|uniref:uncharacterized protein LOC127902346 n=1 Tax=Citrus sinensis TaxID=2711 RepID=UPI002279CFDB|nr:uncharacterized protein LOC127902346 [Citrus sinensis]
MLSYELCVVVHVARYACASPSCEFYLHKSCGELQREIQHPLHPAHRLIFQKADFCSSCNGCGADCVLPIFAYRCQDCAFHLHPQCVYMKPIVKYEDHQHPLTVVEIDNSGLFNKCQACVYDIDGIHLRCVQCRILFHVQCGSQKPNLPQAIVNKHHHEHPLTLTTTETSTIDESNYPLCAACSKKRKPWHPFYSCAECEDYSVHMRCVVTEKQFERDKQKHASHRHYLIFNEKEVGDDDVVIICHLCETSLQGPAYSCGTCELSIHKSCAELPVKIDHPFHRHPLTLSKTNHSSNRCRACLDECSCVAYKCHECCYNLHYRCTSLKPSINFKGHDEHALIYFQKLPSKPKCEA